SCISPSLQAPSSQCPYPIGAPCPAAIILLCSSSRTCYSRGVANKCTENSNRSEVVMIHPWHDVTPGEKLPRECSALIEIPMGSSIKYELDKRTGLLRLDRVLYSAVYYPANYGFITPHSGQDHPPPPVP